MFSEINYTHHDHRSIRTCKCAVYGVLVFECVLCHRAWPLLYVFCRLELRCEFGFRVLRSMDAHKHTRNSVSCAASCIPCRTDLFTSVTTYNLCNANDTQRKYLCNFPTSHTRSKILLFVVSNDCNRFDDFLLRFTIVICVSCEVICVLSNYIVSFISRYRFKDDSHSLTPTEVTIITRRHRMELVREIFVLELDRVSQLNSNFMNFGNRTRRCIGTH